MFYFCFVLFLSLFIAFILLLSIYDGRFLSEIKLYWLIEICVFFANI